MFFMGKSYRPYYPDEELLLPPSLREWLPENHLAYFVSDVVDHLDLSAIEKVYGAEKRGQPPYDPRMMTKLLVYAYCVGVFSSRRIQRRLVEDIAFKVLAAGNEPNFRTISDFRKIHLEALEGLFEQVLKIALEAGAMKLGRVALDGTKMKANASKHKAMSYDRMKDKEKQLRDEVKQLLEQAETADAAEDAQYGKNRRGDELPEELQRRESRLKKIKEAKRVVEARAREKVAAEGADPKEAKPQRQRSVQLHRSGIAHYEGRGWLCAGLQRAGGGGTRTAVDCRPERHSSDQRQATIDASDRGH